MVRLGYPAGLARPPAGRGRRSHGVASRVEKSGRGSAPAPGRTQGVLQRPEEGPGRVATQPRFPGAAVEQEWGRGKTASGARPRPSPRPGGYSRPAGRWRGRGTRAPPPPAGQRRPLPDFPPGAATLFPHQRGTCTARLRKVPASAASFFMLKSMMFILGGSRAEPPADLAGRRRRRDRAGAQGERGGGRRGRWREAAPTPPPQLSFPWRGGGGVRGWGQGERISASEQAARPAAAAEKLGLSSRESCL